MMLIKNHEDYINKLIRGVELSFYIKVHLNSLCTNVCCCVEGIKNSY